MASDPAYSVDYISGGPHVCDRIWGALIYPRSLSFLTKIERRLDLGLLGLLLQENCIGQ